MSDWCSLLSCCLCWYLDLCYLPCAVFTGNVSALVTVFRRPCGFFFCLCSRYERPRLQGLQRGCLPPVSAPRRHSIHIRSDVVTPRWTLAITLPMGPSFPAFCKHFLSFFGVNVMFCRCQCAVTKGVLILHIFLPGCEKGSVSPPFLGAMQMPYLHSCAKVVSALLLSVLGEVCALPPPTHTLFCFRIIDRGAIL